jgi:hypothetical protein
MKSLLQRSYFSASFQEYESYSDSHILGELTKHHPHDLNDKQRNAWSYQIDHLRPLVSQLGEGHLYFEFQIPRMGKRADVLLLFRGVVYILEYKVGADAYDSAAIDQALDYALDLRNFHSTSHSVPIVPILVCTQADRSDTEVHWGDDQISTPLKCSSIGLAQLLNTSDLNEFPDIDPAAWERGAYQPTPTIVEAAMALYAGHSVEEISRSDSGAVNLSETSETVRSLIEKAKTNGEKVICFITGVPGSGKTLAGLNLSAPSIEDNGQQHGVYLSGNGPLVDVLREALSRDEIDRKKQQGERVFKKEAYRKASMFIQNIHHFRDEGLRSTAAPPEKIVVFDEAQRAWTQKNLAAWMKEKKGISDFEMSEPEFLLSYMDRIDDWCVVICLVGGGQEINKGEVGISEWLKAINNKFSHWKVSISDAFPQAEIDRFSDHGDLVAEVQPEVYGGLHLKTSLRSFRSEKVSAAVDAVIENQPGERQFTLSLPDYPFVITRDFLTAKRWLKEQSRGSERIGLVASSKALRLRASGIYVKASISPKDWFLNPKNDVRSSFALEEVASEFDIQGLELDWIGVCWGADLRYNDQGWSHHHFRGDRWNNVNSEFAKRYLENSYRVLLTRARQGTVIFLPTGSTEDPTTNPSYYHGTYEYLIRCGATSLDD